MLHRTKPSLEPAMPETHAPTEPLARPEALLRVPMGLASPLWGFFAGAAMTGTAWWWMTRFTRPENLEAMFSAAESRAVKAATPPLAALEAVDAAALETLDAVEAAVETVAEPAVEAVEAEVVDAAGALDELLNAEPNAPILEAFEVVEAEPVLEAVGGESAPISPVVEVLAATGEVAEKVPVAAVEAAPEAAPEAGPEATIETSAKPKRKAAAPKAD